MSIRTGSFALVTSSAAGLLLPARTVAMPWMLLPAGVTGAVYSGGFWFFVNASGRRDMHSWVQRLQGAHQQPRSPTTMIEFQPTGSSPRIMVASAVFDEPTPGRVDVFLPFPQGYRAAQRGAVAWHSFGSPNNGVVVNDTNRGTAERFLARTAPALVAGPVAGSLELCFGTQDGGIRHYRGDASMLQTWHSSDQDWFGRGQTYVGVALAVDLQNGRLLVLAATETQLLLFTRTDDTWDDGVTVWTPEGKLQLSGVPSLWQEQLSPGIGPRGLRFQAGDLLAAVGLSDGSVQMLRLPYSFTISGEGEIQPSPRVPAAPNPFGKGPQSILAVALNQAPPRFGIPWPGNRPIDLYRLYDGTDSADWVTLAVGAWSPPSWVTTGLASRPH
jgi:hypothetical protein